MTLTVGELLSRPQLRLDVIVPGDMDRVIRWVHSTDMPDPSPYLRGDELVLTAGIWYWHGTAPGSFAASLGHSRAAALGFGTTPLVPEIPDELVQACRGWGLTLFRVPNDVAFIQIAEEFVEAQHRSRERELLDSMDRSSQFAKTLQLNGGFDGLLRVLWQVMPRAAAIVGRRRGVVAAVRQPPSLPADNAEIDKLIDGCSAGERCGDLAVFEVPTADGDAALVIDTGGQELTVSQRTIVDQTLTFIAVELQRQYAVAENERRFADELFELLAAGEAQLPAVTARLQSLGVDEQASFCAITCIGESPETLRVALASRLSAPGRPVVTAVKAGRVLAVTQIDIGADLAEFAQELHEALGTRNYLGVGGVAHDAGGLGRSLLEASHACRFAQRRPEGGFGLHDKLASHALLIGLEDERLLDTFRDTLVAPLQDHDARRHTDLVHTLELFLGSGGRYQQTAEELCVHVNTLRLRLSRIEQLTGRDLGSMDDRVDLWIALRVRDRAAGGTS